MLSGIKIIRAKRRSVSIKIMPDASVVVRAPLRISQKELDLIVEERLEWILAGIEKARERFLAKKEFTLEYGSHVTVMGKEYFITGSDENKVSFDGDSVNLPSGLNSVQIKNAMLKLYRFLAGKVIKEKVEYYANLMELSPKGVKINSARTRWGSCSSKDSINFSWFLIMASESCIDYVIVHELAHLKHLDHSQQFWFLVEEYYPEYKKAQLELKEVQKKLLNEDWSVSG